MEKDTLMWGYRLLIPKVLREVLLKEVHSTHLGISKMKTVCRSYMWWPGLDRDVEMWVQKCEACLQSRSEPRKAEAMKWEVTDGPMDRIHIDFLYLRGKNYLIMIDVYTRWPEVIEMKIMNSKSVIEALREIFARFGLPNKVVSDNGPQFRSDEFINFCRNNSIKFVTSPPYHPATNGAAENAVRSLKSGILKATMDNSNKNVSINTLIQRYLLTYRVTPHWITKEAPSFLMFGRKVKTRLDYLKNSVENKVKREDIQRFRKLYLKVGDQVYARDYSDPNKKRWEKGIVEEVLGKRIYVIKLENKNVVWRRHVDQLLKVGETNKENISTEEKEKGVEQNIMAKEGNIKLDERQINIEDNSITKLGSDKLKECEVGKEEEIVTKEIYEETEKEEVIGRPKRKVKKPDKLNL